MLTLLETAEAIKALQTEPDIIASACEKVLGLNKIRTLDANALAKHLIVYNISQGCSSSILMEALAYALGQMLAMKVVDGKEEELISGLTEVIRHEIYSFQSFEKKLKSILPPEVLNAMADIFAKEVKGFPK